MPPRKNFLMMRHGESVANAQGYVAGSFDTPLTDLGRQQAAQAEATVYAMRDAIDYIVHSALSRSRETAAIVNRRLGLPAFEVPGLGEQDFGDWRGTDYSAMRQKMADGMEPPSGETRADFYRRAELAVMDALQAAAGTPLIVSHGGIFDALRAHRADDRLNVNNCALYMFRWGGDEGRPEWLMGELP